jgi:hypothetical protein
MAEPTATNSMQRDGGGNRSNWRLQRTVIRMGGGRAILAPALHALLRPALARALA